MDAAYVNIDKIPRENAIIYSAGIGEQINFELDILSKVGKSGNIYAIDPTPKSLNFLNNQTLPENFHILPYALAAENGPLDFLLPSEDGWVSGSVYDLKEDGRKLKQNIAVIGKNLKTLMLENGHNYIDLLKMDIEGSEFEVIDSILEDSLNINQMCIDFHHFLFKDSRRKIDNAVKKIRRAGYKVIYADMENRSITCIKML